MMLALTLAFAGAPRAGALAPNAHADRFVGTYTSNGEQRGIWWATRTSS
jgi:hypothetical protein